MTSRKANSNSERGIVYVAENPEIPGKVKIGWTTDLEQRMNDLSRPTGVPGEYTARYAVQLSNPREVKSLAHQAFYSEKMERSEFLH